MNCIFEGIGREDLLFSLSVACKVMGLKRRKYRDNRNDILSRGLLDDVEKECVELYNVQISDIDTSREILLKIHDQLMVDALKESVSELKESINELEESLVLSNG